MPVDKDFLTMKVGETKCLSVDVKDSDGNAYNIDSAEYAVYDSDGTAVIDITPCSVLDNHVGSMWVDQTVSLVSGKYILKCRTVRSNDPDTGLPLEEDIVTFWICEINIKQVEP